MISKLTINDVKKYLRVDDDSEDSIILAIMSSASSYIMSYTGLTRQEIDDYEDLVSAFYCLCSDMFDVRGVAVQNDKVNPTVRTILNMHSVNLL